jgi:hypothetical protein
MSLEFVCKFKWPLSASAIRSVGGAIADTANWKVVRETGRETGFQCWNSERAVSVEQVTILIEPERFHIAFHVGSRDQRNAVLDVCKNALMQSGISCEFEEI